MYKSLSFKSREPKVKFFGPVLQCSLRGYRGVVYCESVKKTLNSETALTFVFCSETTYLGKGGVKVSAGGYMSFVLCVTYNWLRNYNWIRN